LADTVFQPVINDFVPAIGQAFVIIENDGVDPVAGHFQALPEGSLLLVNEFVFAISYQGGDGNDVEFKRVAVSIWDGRPDGGISSADRDWTTATNWVGDVAPAANAILVFPGDSNAPRSSVNDFAVGGAFRAIILTGSAYQLSGNAVSLINGVLNTGDDNFSLLDIQLAGDQAFRSDGSLTLVGSLDLNATTWTLDTRSTVAAGLTVAGVVTGDGQIVKDGLGTASLTAATNSFSAPLLVLNGILDIQSANSFAGKTVLAGGGVQLGNDLALGLADNTPANGIEVLGFGRIVLSPGITIANETVLGAGVLSMEAASGSATWASRITIDGGFTVNNFSMGRQLTFTQPISATRHFSSGLAESPNVYASSVDIDEMCIHEGSVFTGATICGENIFLANSVIELGATVTAAGSATLQTVHVDGTLSASLDISGTDISGDGQIEMPKGTLNDVYPGTAVDIGSLAVGTTTLGDFHAQILGTAGAGVPGGHDLLFVSGILTLSGELDLEVSGTAGVSVGNSFLLIDNDGVDGVKGQFRGLPQGGLVTVGGLVFQIDYSAGTGNDVALTRLAAAVWDGSLDGSGLASENANWTTAANWVGDVAPTANAILIFPAMPVFHPTNVNNFAANTPFNAIRIDGDGYSLGGNALKLSGGVGNRGIGTAISFPITLTAAQGFSNGSLATLSFAAGIDLSGFTLALDSENTAADALLVSGSVSGAGGIVKQGGGLARLAAAANGFTGFVTAAAGELLLDGQNVYAGKTTIGGGAIITLGNPAALGLGNGTDATGVEILDYGILAFSTGILVGGERVSGGGTLTMIARAGSSRWTGGINLGTGLVIDNTGFTGDLGLDGSVTAPSVIAIWNGENRNTIRGTVAANESVFATGIEGTGTIGFVDGELDMIRPGTSLDTGVLSISGGRLLRHASRIRGLTAGSAYDQLAVDGSLDLVGASLSVSVSSGFEPARGDEFVLVAKTGSTPATGHYQSLPQGSILLAGGHVFAIDYRGGDGNDIVLRTLSGDLPPTLTLNAASSIEVNEGSIAARSGQYAASRVGQAVSISASVGNVTQTGSEGGGWNWSQPAVDGPSGPLNVVIRATDPNGVYSEVSFNYRVLNVAPVFTTLTNSASSISCMRPLDFITLTGTFTDAGLTDTHTAIVDWGDGSQSPATITQSPSGGGTLNATHRYIIAGKFTIKVTVIDDDGGAVESTTVTYISGGALVSGTLTVIGTCGGDLVTLARFSDGRSQLTARFCAVGCITGWTQSSVYPPNSITSIRMELGNGKDTATLSELIKTAAFIDTGAGDDVVTGGGGNDTILGGDGLDSLNGGGGDDSINAGTGNDSVSGGSGNDTLVGGAGDDRMFGAAGQDILFGEAGNDSLFGGTTCLDDPNNDILVGGDGRDTLCGGDGRDILVGGRGGDNL
ncbi:MAG: hypothetical protein ACKO38_11255, partial [Planctomycetota bacterium]